MITSSGKSFTLKIERMRFQGLPCDVFLFGLWCVGGFQAQTPTHSPTACVAEAGPVAGGRWLARGGCRVDKPRYRGRNQGKLGQKGGTNVFPAFCF